MMGRRTYPQGAAGKSGTDDSFRRASTNEERAGLVVPKHKGFEVLPKGRETSGATGRANAAMAAAREGFTAQGVEAAASVKRALAGMAGSGRQGSGPRTGKVAALHGKITGYRAPATKGGQNDRHLRGPEAKGVKAAAHRKPL